MSTPVLETETAKRLEAFPAPSQIYLQEYFQDKTLLLHYYQENNVSFVILLQLSTIDALQTACMHAYAWPAYILFQRQRQRRQDSDRYENTFTISDYPDNSRKYSEICTSLKDFLNEHISNPLTNTKAQKPQRLAKQNIWEKYRECIEKQQTTA
uniref:Uncharacterized protein n=1 Tax=Glossina palpalis gambiensis TaxID=67801 RepID=A0A1B0BVY9_9MUSC